MPEKSPTIQETLADAINRLTDSDSPELDAQLLLCEVFGKGRSYLYTWPERELTAEESATFEALLAQRREGIPVAHILGERGFWSLSLKVTPDTLIPRPDTELLVELALELLPVDQTLNIVDLGTGTGAIALAIAHERPKARVTAVERSPAALAVARENRERLGLTNVELLEGSWFEPLPTDAHFDLIVSNPPYVAEADPHLAQGDVRFEPRSALTAGPDGLDDIRHIAAEARNHLKPGGWLLVEHGYDQGDAVANIFENNGYQAITTHQDAADNPRATLGQLPAP